jgi:hypothetical protein
MKELWIDIDGYPNYIISSNGRVKNKSTGRILKPRPATNGYLRVCLYDKDGQRRDLLIHRLGANAFYDGDHDGLDVNHIDGQKDNNFIGNLEWATRSENLKHAYRTKLRDSPHNRCKAIKIVETGEIFKSVRECARYLGVSHSNISLCLNGFQKTCRGYHFETID